jgi:DNA repair exonuclease SbcCD ATPase subunit
MSSLSQHRRRAASLKADYEHALRTATDEAEVLDAATQRHEDSRTAQVLLQQVAQAVQQTAHERIASVVSKCLAAVFGDEAYRFRIHFERKRGKTEARIVLERGGREVDPMDAAGGGVVDVAAFALRVSCLVLSQPPRRRLIVADEPFRFVSAEYRPRVAEMVETLAGELEIQFLIVTHSPEFEIGTVVRI